LRLVDFDEVRPSNINRQLYALSSTLGRPKTEIAEARVRDINADCHIEPMRCFVHADTMEQVLAGPLDLVVDAIDSFTPKIELLSAVRRRGIPLICSMGAALRTDPACVRVGPLEEVHMCPLAAKIRKALRKRQVPLDFTCVYSIEPLPALPEGAIDCPERSNEDLLQRGRQRRPLGSLPTLTGIFGLTAANAALRLLLGPLMPSNKARL
jgi:tRNA A37 threonylcarbamoyladenosine dehydratase